MCIRDSIGIDIGTTGIKSIIIDPKGNCLAKNSVSYNLTTPKPGWAEQNPEDWWQALKSSIKKLIEDSGVKSSDVKGIGLSGQMHGSVFLDKNYHLVRPAILWCDQRTYRECEEITTIIGKDNLIKNTCNPALTGFTAPKILWLKKNEPENFEKTKKILLPKDYIRFKLTGEFATEVSDASGTLLFDVRKRKWSDFVLSNLNIDKSLLPECYESIEVSGKISRIAAEQTGLKEGTPVVGGGGDQAAGGVGNGIVKEGIVSSVIGTSGVIFAFSEKPEIDPEGRLHTFCHAVPEKWFMMGVMLSAGGSFRWLRDTLCEKEIEIANKKCADPYDIMTEEASSIEPGSEGLIFLPYLSGERTPYPDPYARGVFFGLSLRHTKAHLIRAVLEGVTFGLKDSLEIMKKNNIVIKQIRASGGGGKSSLWRQIQADAFNSSVVTINNDEGPAFGAALLASVGTGNFSSVPEACKETIKITSETIPIKENVEIYDKYYKLYRSLYPALKSKFKNLSTELDESKTG